MHYHHYVSRVPGLLANGNAESEPENPGFRISTVPPRLTRRWLLRDQRAVKALVFETVDEATAHYAQWIEDNPRLDSAYGSDDPKERRASKVEYTRKWLAGGSDVVDGFYTPGGEYVSATYIPCPTLDGKWTCPLGRKD